jgi:hypothetical protein
MNHRLTYTDIAENESRVVAMTGVKPEEFAVVQAGFEACWQRRMERITLENTPRERGYKPRKNSVLATAEDRLLFVLSYIKLNPLQEAHGASFGMRQPKVCVWLHHLLAVLEEALRAEDVLPARTNEALQRRLKECRTVLLDATERPIQRSVDEETQREHYSGKKNGIPKSI